MAGCLQSSSFRHCGDDNGRCVVPMPDFCNNHDGCSQTIKSQYSKTSLANMFHKGAHGATGIMEIYDDSSKDTAGNEEGIH